MNRPEFRRPELSDRELIDSYFKAYPSRSCERTFVNVYLWARHYQVQYAHWKGLNLFMNERENRYGFAWPSGPEDKVREIIPELMQMAEEDGKSFCLYSLTPEHFALLDSWYPGMFTIEYDRDVADYVYEAEKLATLSGKKLHSKRNHINRFKAANEGRWSYERMSAENVEECFQMALKWRQLNGCEEDEEKNAEMCVTLNSLRLQKELGLTGGILRVDGEIVAFTIGEPVSEDTFVVHIEKAFADVDGAYPMINQQFVEHEIAGRYLYVNREEDVGSEGLRKAKLSYKPVFMVEKGVAVPVGETTQ